MGDSMRRIDVAGRLALVLGGAMIAWGCGSKDRPVAQAPAPAAPVAAVTPAVRDTGDGGADRLRREREAEQARAAEAARSRAILEQGVHFDYDRSDINPDQRSILEAKLPLLLANRSIELIIEGHADERGSDEYNLALGMRRAASVKRYLGSRGADTNRLDVRSYGEEQPVDPGHTERAWARNRRADFRVTRMTPLAGQ
jgi:peptidoglycan-associated lipoprotein